MSPLSLAVTPVTFKGIISASTPENRESALEFFSWQLQTLSSESGPQRNLTPLRSWELGLALWWNSALPAQSCPGPCPNGSLHHPRVLGMGNNPESPGLGCFSSVQNTAESVWSSGWGAGAAVVCGPVPVYSWAPFLKDFCSSSSVWSHLCFHGDVYSQGKEMVLQELLCLIPSNTIQASPVLGVCSRVFLPQTESAQCWGENVWGIVWKRFPLSTYFILPRALGCYFIERQKHPPQDVLTFVLFEYGGFRVLFMDY